MTGAALFSNLFSVDETLAKINIELAEQLYVMVTVIVESETVTGGLARHFFFVSKK